MSIITRSTVALSAALLLTVGVAPGVVADQGGKTYSIALTGAAEVPGPGDADGTGSALITVNPGHSTVCWDLEVSGVAPIFAAHIHEAPAGVAGPVVVPLSPPTPTASGCATIDKELSRELVRDPASYYVNVHNADHPAGALRGQLG